MSKSADVNTTKERILTEALNLFSERGYNGVSMREIAKAVNITAASIYNHFKSKGEIISELYAYYSEQWSHAMPDMDSIMKAAETEPVASVLKMLDFHYDPAIQDKMDKIIIVAFKEVSSDKRSEQLIHSHIFGSVIEMTDSVLKKLIELDRIEPIDVKAYLSLVTYLSFGTAVLNNSSLKIKMEEWLSIFELLFGLIRPTGK
ncbi:MAG: TetR/AcrR family transcriptional regulator [Oscillospiraceae bacterium]|jgi:AcrR family transcriptional regulator|nr:TetR/AcrR family transcriptional regulator [Oscillospiraceae bacterium]